MTGFGAMGSVNLSLLRLDHVRTLAEVVRRRSRTAAQGQQRTRETHHAAQRLVVAEKLQGLPPRRAESHQTPDLFAER